MASNVNIGGLEGDLILNTREWTQPGRDALASLRALGAGVTSALDGINRNTREMAAGMRDLQKTTRQVSGAVAESFRQLGQTVSSVATVMRDSVKDVVVTFAGFDKQMRNTDAIAKLTQGQLRDLSKSVREMGGDLQLTQGPTSLATGLKEIASAGYNASDSLKILAAAAKAADAGDTSAAIIAKGVTPTLKDYGLTADKATLVTDQLFRAIDQGNLSAEDIATQFGSVAPIAAQAGVSLQELSGAFALMSTKGQTASENATQLRSVINHLQAPAVDAAKLLKQYGVEAGESAIRTKGLIGVLQDLYKRTGGNKVALKRILDDEGSQAAAKLIGVDKGASFDAAIKYQFSADGATQDAFNRQSEGIIFKLNQVKAAFENFKIGVGAGFEPILNPLADGLQKVATYLVKLPDGTKAAIGGFTALAAVVTSVASGVFLLSPNLIQISRFVTDLGGVSVTATRALASLEGGLATVGSVMAELASPVAAVVAGVATLGLAWQKDWGHIREFTAEVVADIQDGVKNVASSLAETFGPVVRRIASDFQAGWPVVKDFMMQISRGVFEQAVPAMRALWESVKLVFGGLGTIVQTAWGVVSPVFSKIKDAVFDMTSAVSLILTGDWKHAWAIAAETVEALGPRMRVALDQVVVNVQAGLVELGRKIHDAIVNALEGHESADMGAQIGAAIAPAAKPSRAHKGVLADFQETLRQDQVAGAFGRFGASAASILSPTSRAAIIAGQIGTGGGVDDVPSIRKGRSGKSLTPAQMLAYIRSNAGVYGDIGGLDQDTLKATYQLVRNSVMADFKLQITSAARHGSGGSFHNSGRAVDIQAAGRANVDNDPEVSGMIQRLASGTGFRSGINEFRTDARRVTGGTGPHVHLTTGLERTGQGAVPGAFLVRGGGGSGSSTSVVAAIQAYQKDLAEAKKLVAEYQAKSLNQFDQKRFELKQQFEKAKTAAEFAGADESTMRQLSAQYRKQISDVNQLEKRETAATVAELTIKRLEAEGKLGEAASARIRANADEEKAALQEKLKLYPQLVESIAATGKAIDENASRQLGNLQIQQGGQRFNQSSEAQDFQRRDPGLESLRQAFPEFRAEVESAYAAIQRYIHDPAEANREGFELARQSLEAFTAQAQEAQQRKLQEVEFERALGQLTADEAISRQGMILQDWVGGEESKRQAILQYSEVYREHLQRQLELQGEFNLSSLESLAESLNQAGQLTAQQQGQLIAVNQMIQQQRLQDQQNWQGILQSSMGAFQGFLGGLLNGQQSFGQSFTQLWKGIAQQVLQELVKMIVKATLLQKILSSIFGWFGGILGIGGGATAAASSVANPFPDIAPAGFVGPWPTMHTGGWVGGVRRFHSGGFTSGALRSDELMAVLQTGEYVLSRQQLAAMRGAQGQTQQAGPMVNVGGITVHAQVSSEMDIDRLGDRLGRQIMSTLQGVVN